MHTAICDVARDCVVACTHNLPVLRARQVNGLILADNPDQRAGLSRKEVRSTPIPKARAGTRQYGLRALWTYRALSPTLAAFFYLQPLPLVT